MFVLPGITARDAQARLKPRGGWRSWFLRPWDIVRVELCYLPHYLFEVVVSRGGTVSGTQVALEGVTGTFALWHELPTFPTPCEPGVVLDFVLPCDRARELAVDECRGQLIRTALASGPVGDITGVRDRQEVHYPYWVVYFRRSGKWDLAVIDAVLGTIEGPRVRSAVLTGLMAAPGSGPGPSGGSAVGATG